MADDHLLIPNPPEAPKSFKIEERYGPIALGAAVLGLIVGALDGILKIITLVETSFYVAITVFWVIAIAFSRYYPKYGFGRLRLTRFWIIVGATALFVSAITLTYYDRHLRKTGPAARPLIRLNSLFPSGAIAYAAEQTLKLTSFYLNEDLSSYEQRQEPLFASGPQVKTFAVNRDVAEAFRAGRCSGVEGERPLLAAASVIKKWLASTDRAQLTQYLSSPSDLGRLARERGDIFKQIMPSSEELLAIRQASPGDYIVLKKWILGCVGVYQPVLTMVLANSGKSDLDVVEVQYDVKQVGQVLGGEAGGPVWPEVTFDHELRHSAGLQPFPLKPVFHIPAGATKSFNLRLLTRDMRPGLGWFMSVRAIDSAGQRVATEPFQVYLNPK